MSRRFGRNQRRRARERIAELEQAYARESGLLQYTTSRIDALEGEIRRAKRLVGANSFLFDPLKQAIREPRGGRTTIEAHVMRELSIDEMASEARFERIPLDLVLTRVNRDELTGAVHCIVHFAGREVCYAISGLALASVHYSELPDFIHRNIAPTMAEELARQLLSARGATARSAA